MAQQAAPLFDIAQLLNFEGHDLDKKQIEAYFGIDAQTTDRMLDLMYEQIEVVNKLQDETGVDIQYHELAIRQRDAIAAAFGPMPMMQAIAAAWLIGTGMAGNRAYHQGVEAGKAEAFQQMASSVLGGNVKMEIVPMATQLDNRDADGNTIPPVNGWNQPVGQA